MNWAILIILNNYFHDVATATLLSSGVIMYVLGRQARNGGAGERRALARAYRTLRARVPDAHALRPGRARLDHHRGHPEDDLLQPVRVHPGTDQRDRRRPDREARVPGQRGDRRLDHVASHRQDRKGRARRAGRLTHPGERHTKGAGRIMRPAPLVCVLLPVGYRSTPVSFMASTISLGTPRPMAADIFEIPMPMKSKFRP